MIIRCKKTAAASDLHVVTEVAGILDRRAALRHPPVTLAVSDAVALGIAGIFRSPTPSGQVLERFYRSGSIDSTKLIEAVQVEQGYASAEGHAALYCLIGWVHAQRHTQAVPRDQ